MGIGLIGFIDSVLDSKKNKINYKVLIRNIPFGMFFFIVNKLEFIG